MNNRLVPKEKAVVSVFDHGFLYGDGIYETLRVYNGVAFKIDEHIERLCSSASMIGLKLPKPPHKIKDAVYKTVQGNKHKDAVVRITVSRGPGPLGLDPALCPEPTFVIMSNAFSPYPPAYHQKGIPIAIVNTRRNFYRALDPRIKSLNFLNNILAKREAKEMGALEAIMLNYRGCVSEGTVSNIFFLRDNVLCTPSLRTGILDGITRATILEIARGFNLDIKEGCFKGDDIFGAREVFISNTTMEVMPVSTVNGRATADVPGRITKKLREAYKTAVLKYIKGEQ